MKVSTAALLVSVWFALGCAQRRSDDVDPDAGRSVCAEYRTALATCRGAGPSGALALRAHDALVAELQQTPGGRDALVARCKQLSDALLADSECSRAMQARDGH